MADLEPTIDLIPRDRHAWIADTNSPLESIRNSRLRVGSQSDSSDRVSNLFDESTRQLLRERLIIAAILLAGMIAVVQVIVSFNGTFWTNATLARLAVVTTLTGVVMLLRGRPNLTLNQLRWTEIVVVVVPLFEVLYIQHLETTRLIEIGKPHQVPMLMGSIGGVICLFVATYAMFIPSNWRRTAVVAFASAILPTILTAVQFANVAGLRHIEYPGFATPFLLFTTAVVATIAAHFVRSIRHEAESARQYGQYHLTTEIGRGSMGVVYRAEHRMLKRPAAIKLIRADRAASEQAVARFEQEVQMSATLSHWNTVQIYDYGRTAGGDFFYVMEFLEGKTLAQQLAADGPMKPEAAVEVIRQVCNGLEEAHAKTLVHRDLKPANIFLTNCGSQSNLVKILDFGLATSHARPDNDRSVSGSPPYMPPEQIRGDQVDGRSDIYSIGCMLYECVKGKPLFTGDSIPEVFDKHLKSHPSIELQPELANDLMPIIEKVHCQTARRSLPKRRQPSGGTALEPDLHACKIDDCQRLVLARRPAGELFDKKMGDKKMALRMSAD